MCINMFVTESVFLSLIYLGVGWSPNKVNESGEQEILESKEGAIGVHHETVYH